MPLFCFPACSLTDGTLTGSFSLCTSEGISGGRLLPGFPLDNITLPGGACSSDRDCNTAGGQFCSRAETSSACACGSLSGEDSCTTLGSCQLTPCARCQRCISSMQAAVQTRLQASGASRPSQVEVVGAFNSMCEPFAPTGGYPTDACLFIISTYIMAPPGGSGYFGLRPAAVCSSLGQCSALPADCLLQVTSGSPLLNVTGSLDMCSAEGVAGGSALAGVSSAAGNALLLTE